MKKWRLYLPILLTVLMWIVLPVVATSENGQIAFIRMDEFDGNMVNTINPDGTPSDNPLVWRFCDIPGCYNDGHPTWSPDGKYIAVTTMGKINIIKIDTRERKNITNSEANDSEPSWSPDGTKIVFTSDRDGNNEIYVMNANGTGQTRLTYSAASDSEPSWSPDGKEIVFTSNRDGNNEIYIMYSDGIGQTRLTYHAASDSQPELSPDGTKIVFYIRS